MNMDQNRHITPYSRSRSSTINSNSLDFGSLNHSSISLPKPSYGSRNSISGGSKIVPSNSSLTSLNPTVLQNESTHSFHSDNINSNSSLNDLFLREEPVQSTNNFVEFDLTEKKKPTRSTASTIQSISNFNKHIAHNKPNELIEEPSAPNSPTQKTNAVKIEDFFDFNSGNDWKEMPTVTEHDFYNERGDLEFEHEANESNTALNEVHDNNTSKGYTRIDAEEQATKYSQLDSKTEFLFQDHKHSTSELTKNENDSDYDEFDNYNSDDNINPVKKLQSVKSMLKESQRFAYVGITKLITVDMAMDLAKIKLSTSNKIAKNLSNGQKNFSNWTLYVMSKLYDHMELNEEERVMIEKLSKHGVEVEDLSSSLNKCEVIDNPMYEENGIENENDDTTLSPDLNDKVGILKPEDISGHSKLTIDLKWTIICDLFLILLSDGYYDARSRELLLTFAKHLQIPQVEIYQFERRITENLEIDTNTKSIENKDESLNDKQFIKKRAKRDRKKKLAYIGLATLGGGLVIGLSAGLLAPVIGAGLAAGLTTIGISGTAGFLAGVGGTTIVTTTGVIAGARIGSRGMAKRVGAVETFEFRPLHNNKRTNLIITVSGWMNGKADDVRLPFSTIDPVMGDMFSLLWEPEMLQSMGQTINILATEALATSIQQILGATILAALMASLQLPMALSKLGYLLDNPWNVSLDRAWSAGKILADTLVSGNLGVRPITLVGFSLGARLIYSCLIELAKRGAFGLIENVILFGSPVTVKNDQLAMAKSVVSGKFINGFSKKDWVLGYLFRATSGGLQTVAGLTELKTIHGVDNFDCTDYVTGHMEYRKNIPLLLSKLDWQVLSEEFVEIDEPDPEEGERTRKLIHEFDEAREKMVKDELDRSNSQKRTWKRWFKPKKKEWWEIYEEGAKQSQENELKRAKEQSENASTDGSTEYEINPESNEPIFDVNALMSEIEGIENLAYKDSEPVRDYKLNPPTSGILISSRETIDTTVASMSESSNPFGKKDTSLSVDEHDARSYEEYEPNIQMSFGTVEEPESQPQPEPESELVSDQIQMSFGSELDGNKEQQAKEDLGAIQMSFGNDAFEEYELAETTGIRMSFGDPSADNARIETSPEQSSVPFPSEIERPHSFYSY